MKFLEEVDKVLLSKSLPVLTEYEKEAITNNCRGRLMQWNVEPKATDNEYALEKQVKNTISNAIYDVLVQTRNYGKS